MSTDEEKNKNPKETPPANTKSVFIEEFCSKHGCTPQEKFFLEKTCKGQELSESEWKKKLEDGNKN